MASIEVSLSSTANRRRKSSIGRDSSSKSTVSSRSEIAPSRELRSALQDREAVIQRYRKRKLIIFPKVLSLNIFFFSLRLQLGLAKLPRPVGPPFDEADKPVAEKKLTRLKIEAENKRVGIRNLKSAMEKLEISE
jgi:sulfur dioxygenase